MHLALACLTLLAAPEDAPGPAPEVPELSVLAHFGGLEYWQVLKTQELFAREVAPLLAR